MKLYFTLIFLFLSRFIYAEDITVFYYERPPFYFTNKERSAAGILVDKVRKLKSPKYNIIFKVFPPKRQVLAIESGNKNVCGLGWFKNENRLKNGTFSSKIYTDEPLGLAIHKNFGSYKSISVKDVFSNSTFDFLKKNSFIYGENIEKVEAKLKPNTYIVSSSIVTMLEMIAIREKYYTLIDKIEVDYILSLKPALKDSLIFIPIDEIKDGNTRYLYCSKNIPHDFSKLMKSFSF